MLKAIGFGLLLANVIAEDDDDSHDDHDHDESCNFFWPDQTTHDTLINVPLLADECYSGILFGAFSLDSYMFKCESDGSGDLYYYSDLDCSAGEEVVSGYDGSYNCSWESCNGIEVTGDTSGCMQSDSTYSALGEYELNVPTGCYYSKNYAAYVEIECEEEEEEEEEDDDDSHDDEHDHEHYALHMTWYAPGTGVYMSCEEVEEMYNTTLEEEVEASDVCAAAFDSVINSTLEIDCEDYAYTSNPSMIIYIGSIFAAALALFA